MSSSPTPLQRSRRSGCALLRAHAAAGTGPGHQPCLGGAGWQPVVSGAEAALASTCCSVLQPPLRRRVPQETSQAPGCSSPSLRANPGSALTSNSFCLQEGGYKPLPVSASSPA